MKQNKQMSKYLKSRKNHVNNSTHIETNNVNE